MQTGKLGASGKGQKKNDRNRGDTDPVPDTRGENLHCDESGGASSVYLAPQQTLVGRAIHGEHWHSPHISLKGPIFGLSQRHILGSWDHQADPNMGLKPMKISTTG